MIAVPCGCCTAVWWPKASCVQRSGHPRTAQGCSRAPAAGCSPGMNQVRPLAWPRGMRVTCTQDSVAHAVSRSGGADSIANKRWQSMCSWQLGGAAACCVPAVQSAESVDGDCFGMRLWHDSWHPAAAAACLLHGVVAGGHGGAHGVAHLQTRVQERGQVRPGNARAGAARDISKARSSLRMQGT